MPNYEEAMEKAKQLSQTSEGQQLVKMLQQVCGQDWEQTLQAANAGNFAPIQQAFRKLSENPDARNLLEKMVR